MSAADVKSLGRMLQSITDPVVKRFLQGVEQNISVIDRRLKTLEVEVRPDWRDAELKNGWLAYGNGFDNPGFYKTDNGLVSLRGVIASGTVTSGTVLFTLPAEYRPENANMFVTVSNAGASDIIGRVDVMPNGDVVIQDGGNTFLSLDGVHFYAYR